MKGWNNICASVVLGLCKINFLLNISIRDVSVIMKAIMKVRESLMGIYYKHVEGGERKYRISSKLIRIYWVARLVIFEQLRLLFEIDLSVCASVVGLSEFSRKIQ